MRLDYATLISPYPLRLTKIGSVKSPTLREIFSPDVTYKKYGMYLSFLLMDSRTYCENVDPSRAGWYHSLSEEKQANTTMFDIIADDRRLQSLFSGILDFFFEETVIWDGGHQMFFLFIGGNSDREQPDGVIHREVFSDVADIILQRCAVSRTDTGADISRVKNNRAREILKKIQSGRQNKSINSHFDSDMELPNLLSAIAVKSRSVNFINVWDLTVFQLYEQFKREQANVYFDIQKMSVAAYGNKEKSFKGTEWYKNEN